MVVKNWGKQARQIIRFFTHMQLILNIWAATNYAGYLLDKPLITFFSNLRN